MIPVTLACEIIWSMVEQKLAFSSLAPMVLTHTQRNGSSNSPVWTWPVRPCALVLDLEKLGLAFERSFPCVLFSKLFDPRCSVTSKGDHFLGTFFKKELRKSPKLSSLAPPARAEMYSILFYMWGGDEKAFESSDDWHNCWFWAFNSVAHLKELCICSLIFE